MTMTTVGNLPVSTFAADAVASVTGDADLWRIAETMVEADVGALTVGEGDDVRGIVSERDIVRALSARRDPSATTAADIAHTSLVWCDAAATVAEVATEMMERYVPPCAGRGRRAGRRDRVGPRPARRVRRRRRH